MQREGMNRIGKLIRQHVIDTSMARQQPLPFEFGRNQHHFKMALGARRNVVIGGLVNHFEVQRRQRVHEFVFDDVLNRHEFSGAPTDRGRIVTTFVSPESRNKIASSCLQHDHRDVVKTTRGQRGVDQRVDQLGEFVIGNPLATQ